MNTSSAYPISGSFTDVYDNQVNYSSFEGKYVLFEVFATWCPHCQNFHATLEDVYEAYKGDVYMVSISGDGDDTLQDVKDFNSDYPTPWSLGYDADLFDKISEVGYPTLYLLDTDGTALESWSGDQTTNETIGNAIEYHVKENPTATEPPETTLPDPYNPERPSVLETFLTNPVVRMVGIITIVVMVYFKSTRKSE